MQVMPAGPYQCGDILGFSGTDLVSRVVKFGTVKPCYWFKAHWRCVSHVGICCNYKGRVVLVESTTLMDEPCLIQKIPFSGVQAHWPEQRVKSYRGYVFRARLSKRWRFTPQEAEAFSRDVLDYIGVPYDMLGAIRSGLGTARDSDERLAFCSEIGYGALARAGRVPLANASEFTPVKLLEIVRNIGTYDDIQRIK